MRTFPCKLFLADMMVNNDGRCSTPYYHKRHKMYSRTTYWRRPIAPAEGPQENRRYYSHRENIRKENYLGSGDG
jgi:hypothetical protein